MCTLICRWAPDATYPIRMLALRDELASRAFDLPGAWWPDQSSVIGGRDRQAGGTWCASDITTGVNAVVLNRPEKREAAPGAASRGVLPLRALSHGERWAQGLDVKSMAGFNLVLAGPTSLTWWSYDGQSLQRNSLVRGTYVFTPRGLTDGADPRFDGDLDDPTRADERSFAQVWGPWLTSLRRTEPVADPTALLVEVPIEQDTYGTVFGQFIAAQAGSLRVDYLTDPTHDRDRRWTTTYWPD
ncbi:MAG: NRDE family protein [Jatrophihabitantaceae bacterium]